jgi:hypothetical protein
MHGGSPPSPVMCRTYRADLSGDNSPTLVWEAIYEESVLYGHAKNVSLQNVKHCVESGKTHYGHAPVRLASHGGRRDTTSAHASVPVKRHGRATGAGPKMGYVCSLRRCRCRRGSNLSGATSPLPWSGKCRVLHSVLAFA